MTTVGGPARLFRNVAPKRGHWLLVRAVDPALHRDAYGARVSVRGGGRRRVGLVCPGQSYSCPCDPRVHFGLGPQTRIDTIMVDWPDGTEEMFPGSPVDSHLPPAKRGRENQEVSPRDQGRPRSGFWLLSSFRRGVVHERVEPHRSSRGIKTYSGQDLQAIVDFR